MKALTIYQPWASLIMAGAKPYEFRGWSPRERGGAHAKLIGQRIVIHASTRNIDRNDVRALLSTLKYGTDEARAETCLHAELAIPVLERAMQMWARIGGVSVPIRQHGDLPWSVGLGTVILGEPRNGLEIAEEFGVPRANDSDRDNHANFGWPMLDIEVWNEPVEARGLQGFWNWPTPEALGL